MSYVLRLSSGRYVTQNGPRCASQRIRNAKVFDSHREAFVWKETFRIDCTICEVNINDWTDLPDSLVLGDETVGHYDTRKDSLVRVDVIGIEHETAMAVLFMFDGGNEPVYQWVPKALIHDQEDDHFFTFKHIAEEYNEQMRTI